MTQVKILIHTIRKHDIDPTLNLVPEYQTIGAAGADLVACIPFKIPVKPGDRVLIPTGIKLEIPVGVEAQIRSRSGLALKNGLFVLNSPATIDSDFRGELGVILANFGSTEEIIIPGMRIAQIVFAPVLRALFENSKQLQITDRGAGGFGHTGLLQGSGSDR